MSNNREQYWDDEEDDNDEYTPSYQDETDLVKKLRRDLKAAQRRNKELETSYADLSKSQKERIIKDVLTSKGINAKVAQFVPSDIDTNADAISAWLDANADVFGFQSEDKPAVPAQDISAMKKMDSVLTGAEPASSDSAEALIANANSVEDILSLISGQ
jgi:hypothetical protein